MRVLITGASGLIGGRLARHLDATGHEVILASRDVGNASLAPGFQVVTIDFDDESTLDLATSEVDVVVHAAGMNASDSGRDPTAAFRINATGTERMAAAARRHDVGKFIYLSTAHVYASPLIGEIREETEARNQHPYATSHLAGEVNALNIGGDGGMDVVVLRLSNAFGAPVHPAVNCWMLVANDLCRQWAISNTLKLSSSGLQQRNFTTLTAVCQTIERLLSTESGKIVCNLGGQTMSVLDMAERIQDRAALMDRSRPALTHDGSIPGEGSALIYRTDRLSNLIGEVPQAYDAEIDDLLSFCSRHFRN